LFGATDRWLFIATTVHFIAITADITAAPMLQPTSSAPAIESVTLPFLLMTAPGLFKSP
jgi:hypothetical protein